VRQFGVDQPLQARVDRHRELSARGARSRH
jgi:hypothetical protein